MLILRGVGAVAIIAALFLILSGGDDDDGGSERQAAATAQTTGPEGPQAPERKPPPQIPVIKVVNGEPVGGLAELDYERGDRVRFRVDSDVADEVHVHGYNILRKVAAGGSVGFDFVADLEGIYEVELEQRGTHLAELTVTPG
jgi:hypothetical protein